jgi:transposase
VELRSLAKEWINRNEKPEIVNLAEAEGHKVLFTPPYHSDFQPIELVWARVKGNVGRKYTNATTMKDVLERLDAEFVKLQSSGHASIQGND